MPNSDPTYKKAIDTLNGYLQDAKNFGEKQANCCFLATSNKDSQPSVRIITIYEINEKGLLFLACKNSGKVIQIKNNPKTGICFYWPSLNIQVTIEGIAEELDQAMGESLWRRRDHDAQITAWALDMVTEKNQQDNIQKYKTATKQRFKESKPPLPESWAGFSIKPHRIEFWRTDWRKNQKRNCFTKKGGYWHESRYH